MSLNAILRLPQVTKITGCSRSFIYQKMKDGEFPASILLGARAIGWLASDIESWIESRVAVSRTMITH